MKYEIEINPTGTYDTSAVGDWVGRAEPRLLTRNEQERDARNKLLEYCTEHKKLDVTAKINWTNAGEEPTIWRFTCHIEKVKEKGKLLDYYCGARWEEFSLDGRSIDNTPKARMDRLTREVAELVGKGQL